MPTFNDNSDFLAEIQSETLDLPIRGKVFRFAGSPSLLVGAKLREMQRKLLLHAQGKLPADAIVLDDPRGTYVEMVGDQYTALMAAGVTESEFDLIGSTLLNYYLYGAAAAERTWTGELQKAMADDEQANEGEAKPTGTTKTATPKAKAKPSPGGPRTTRSSRSSKATSAAATTSASPGSPTT